MSEKNDNDFKESLKKIKNKGNSENELETSVDAGKSGAPNKTQLYIELFKKIKPIADETPETPKP